MPIHKTIIRWLRQVLCDHEFEVLYLDSRFRVERENPIHYWVCRCKKCRKIMRIESGRMVL